MEVSVSQRGVAKRDGFGGEAEKAGMLRGLTTMNFWTDDMEAAKEWYTAFLGIEPYFVRPVEGPPAYVEFRLGDYQHELGIVDSSYAPEGAASDPGGGFV